MTTAQGQSDLKRRQQNDELLEKFALDQLAKVLEEKRTAKFSGSVAIKLELQAGLVQTVHADDHSRVTGEMLRKPAPKQ